MPSLQLVQLLALVLIFGAVGGVVASTIWWFARRNHFDDLPPESRLRRIVAASLLPIGAGLLFASVALVPSVLDAVGLVSDHCHAHPNHHFHLCFVHTTHVHASAVAWLPVAIAAIWLTVRIGRTGLAHYRARARTRELRDAGEYDESSGSWVLPSDRPFAATTGLLDPELLVSTSLLRELDEPQRQAVEAHEREHARHRHGLKKLLVDIFASCQIPRVRRFLRRELDLAYEQIADRRAAAEVGGSVPVAETILRVERLVEENPDAGRRTAFDTSSVERRVVGLLDEPWGPPRIPALGTTLGVAIWGLFVAHHEVHHWLETLLSLLV